MSVIRGEQPEIMAYFRGFGKGQMVPNAARRGHNTERIHHRDTEITEDARRQKMEVNKQRNRNSCLGRSVFLRDLCVSVVNPVFLRQVAWKSYSGHGETETPRDGGNVNASTSKTRARREEKERSDSKTENPKFKARGDFEFRSSNFAFPVPPLTTRPTLFTLHSSLFTFTIPRTSH